MNTPSNTNDMPRIQTLQELLEWISTADHLNPTQRRDLRSAIRSVGRSLDRPLNTLPADLGVLRKKLQPVHFVPNGISRKRLQNIRSGLVSAIGCARALGIPAGRPAPLSASWKTLYDSLPTKRLQNGLSGLMHYCSEQGIDPAAGTNTVVDAYLEHLEHHTLKTNLKRIHRTSCLLWNEAAEQVPAWPRHSLTIPSYRRPPKTIPWHRFTTEFQANVEQHLAWLAGNDPFAIKQPPRVCKPSTVALRRKHVHLLASAAVRGGVSIETLKSLDEMTTRRSIESALRWYLDQNQQQHTMYQKDLAVTLFAIANHWIGADPGHLRWLRDVIRRLTPKHSGLTAKNRATLRQFDCDKNVQRLLLLPERLLVAAKKRPSAQRRAIAVQLALAIELLLVAPMRIRNLVSLELGTHLVRPSGQRGPVIIVLNADEVKNATPQEYPLPAETKVLLNSYLTEHRPVLLSDPDLPWLFPGAEGDHKAERTLSQQITEIVLKETGLQITPHQFRHLAAKLQLDANPGSYETVRRVLGHRCIKTTTQFYAGMETRQAVEQYDQLLTQRREQHRGGTSSK